MPELTFDVGEIRPEPYAAVPQLTARIRVTAPAREPIHAIALRAQVRIHPQRRGYSADEASGLVDLFGPRERWGTTLKSFLWLHCSTTVQGFTGEADFDLPLPVTYDFDVVASKYLHALRERTVPIELLFSGTVFTRGENGFGVEQVPWNCDASYQLPVSVWRDLMDRFYPNAGWIRLDRDVLDDLARHRSALGLTSWEATVSELLSRAGDPVS